MERAIINAGSRALLWLPLLLLLAACDSTVDLPPIQIVPVPEIQPSPFTVERHPVNDITELLMAPDGTFFAVDSGNAISRETGRGWETILSICDTREWAEIVELLPLGRDDLLFLVNTLAGIQKLIHWNGIDLVEQGEISQGYVDLAGDRERGIWLLEEEGIRGEIHLFVDQQWALQTEYLAPVGWELMVSENGQAAMFIASWMVAFVEGDSLRIHSYYELIGLGLFHKLVPAGGDRYHIVTDQGYLLELTPDHLTLVADPPHDPVQIFSAWSGDDNTIHILLDIDPDDFLPCQMRIVTWDAGAWSTFDLPLFGATWTAAGNITDGIWIGGRWGSRAFGEGEGNWSQIEYHRGTSLYALAERDGLWVASDGNGKLLRKEPGGDWIATGYSPYGMGAIIDLVISDEGEIFGVNGGQRIYRWLGIVWAGQTLPFGHSWQGIWTDDEGGVWVCGSGGSLGHLVNGVWEEVVTGLEGEFRAGACIAERIMVVGRSGVVAYFDGEGWSRYYIPEATSFEDIAGGADGLFYAVDEDGLLWCDLNRSTVIFNDPTAQPTSLAITPGGELWICGYDGLLASWGGEQAFPSIYANGGTILYSLVAGSDGLVRAVGEGGVILAYDPVRSP